MKTTELRRGNLVDRYDREITDIRVSVTRRCNFRCFYCHDEGQGPVVRPGAPSNDEISPAEIERILMVSKEFGIDSVKFSGGEPLVRSDFVEIVRRARRHMTKVSMTTNGALLAGRAEALRDAGLERVNVSVDTLDPEAFRSIRGGPLAPVLRGIESAIAAGLTPVKVNVVLLRQTREILPELIEHIGNHDGLELQLIQFMPELVGAVDGGVDLTILERDLASMADRIQVRAMHHRRVYHVGKAKVELVDPVGNPEFCAHCRRIRVTYDGRLKGCLNRNDDLVPTRGLDDDGLREAFREVVRNRVPYYGVHIPIDSESEVRPWASDTKSPDPLKSNPAREGRSKSEVEKSQFSTPTVPTTR